MDIQNFLAPFESRMQAIRDLYFRKMGEHLRNIGELTASDAHRIAEMKRMGANIREIKARIAAEANTSTAEIDKLLAAVARSDMAFARQWLGKDYKMSKALKRAVLAQMQVTRAAMANLSDTTVVSDRYRNAIDMAVHAVQTGVSDYHSAIRSAIREAGGDGMKLEYASGYRRRADSAARQNVLDGARSMNSAVMEQIGEEFGADGIEISAHALCAEDHLPYQGRQYSKKQFEAIQNSLRRPFGQWNCRHSVTPIILGVSARTYTDADLEAMRRNSTEEITIDGKTLTRYEWTQQQRKIETAIRRQKDTELLAKSADDDALVRECDANIDALTKRYDSIRAKAGLNADYTRMYVAGTNSLTKSSKSSKINTKIINGQVVDPMSIDLYETLKQRMKKYGVTVLAATNDDLRYLKYFTAEASYGNNYIMHQGKIPSASALYEEIVHAAQANIYGELESISVDSYVERAARECAAQKYLLAHADEFEFSEQDVKDMRLR